MTLYGANRINAWLFNEASKAEWTFTVKMSLTPFQKKKICLKF